MRDENEGRKRRRRDQRKPLPEGFRLLTRDIDIVEAVHQNRLMRQDQIQRRFFGPLNRSGAQRRLELLYDGGYLERRFLPPTTEGEWGGRSPNFYVLDKKGAELLEEKRGYDDLKWRSSWLDISADFLKHSIALSEFRLSVELAASQFGFEIERWDNEKDMKAEYDRVKILPAKGLARNVSLIPDGFFIIIAKQHRFPFFIELERTTPVKRFRNKILSYERYFKSGQYEERYNLRAMRVLIVIDPERQDEEKHLASLIQATEALKPNPLYFFTKLSQVNQENVLTTPLWSVAGRQKLESLIPMS